MLHRSDARKQLGTAGPAGGEADGAGTHAPVSASSLRSTRLWGGALPRHRQQVHQPCTAPVCPAWWHPRKASGAQCCEVRQRRGQGSFPFKSSMSKILLSVRRTKHLLLNGSSPTEAEDNLAFHQAAARAQCLEMPPGQGRRVCL